MLFLRDFHTPADIVFLVIVFSAVLLKRSCENNEDFTFYPCCLSIKQKEAIQNRNLIHVNGLKDKLAKVSLAARKQQSTCKWKAARKAFSSLHFLSMERKLNTTEDLVSLSTSSSILQMLCSKVVLEQSFPPLPLCLCACVCELQGVQ